jgi:hypothetical protein
MGHINIQRLEMSGPRVRALATKSPVTLSAQHTERSGGLPVPVAYRRPRGEGAVEPAADSFCQDPVDAPYPVGPSGHADAA